MLDLVLEDSRWNSARLAELAERSVSGVFDHLGMSKETHDVVLLGCDDSRIAELNTEFRGKQTSTNVLSWPSAERGATKDGGPPISPEPGELGDIAIAYDTCAREAEGAGKTLADHTTHLVIHGLLHLLGYDHERPGDAALMEGLEIEILGKLGIRNPYALE